MLLETKRASASRRELWSETGGRGHSMGTETVKSQTCNLAPQLLLVRVHCEVGAWGWKMKSWEGRRVKYGWKGGRVG